MIKNSLLFFILLSLLYFSGCEKVVTIDGSSQERFWKSVGVINKKLPRDEIAEFQFALTKLRKSGYTEDDLALMSEPPVDARFLRSVHGKTVKEIVQMANLSEASHVKK